MTMSPPTPTRFDDVQSAIDFRRVARALRFLDTHRGAQPTLAEVAAAVDLSPYHFQRLFKRWAGVSPKRFLQYLTREHAKTLLAEGESLLQTALGAGLSGSSRLHDLFVATEGVTPGQFRALGRGLEIRHGVAPSPFGPCAIASTDRGVLTMDFARADGAWSALEQLQTAYPMARYVSDDAAAAEVAERAFAGDPSRVLLVGTPFQLKVWEALIRLPPGTVTSYGRIARHIGRPRASRAVGQAVARNRLAWLVPCHRVIREIGATGDYRWGPLRKRAILAWESSRCREGASGRRGGDDPVEAGAPVVDGASGAAGDAGGLVHVELA